MTRRHARLGMSAASVLLGALTLLGAAAAFFTGGTSANAQFFFDDRYPYFERRRPPQYGPGPFRDFLFRDHRETPRPQPVDSSKAPAPARKPDPNAKTILVLGDSMADWLAYGLEEAFAETPELGVSRKHRTPSGLIRNEARADSFDWVQSARDILSAEKPSFIIMMIGMADRQPIRERIAVPAQAAPRGQAQQRPTPSARANEQTAEIKSPEPKADQAGPEQQAAEQPGPTESPSIVAPEPAPSGTHRHEFRSERWAELYAKRVDDLIAVLKSKGVPVYWVGLPPVRGTRSTAEIAYLNDLFRSHAERAGIVYVDVWDGFVDENGNYAVQGPDVAGQTRRLRAGDGVHFTKHGARKLAHYVEREIQRTLTARPMTVTLPEPEEPTPQTGAPKASGPAPRAPAGPIVYLTGPPKEGQELLGSGGTTRPAPAGPAAEVLVKGEPLSAPAGRGDDFAWPRRPIATTSVSNIQEPETPPAPGSAAARSAPAQAPAHPSGPAAARPQQKMAQPKAAPAPSSRSSFFPFWPFGR